MKSLAKEYPDIEVRVYEAGADAEYIPKYGMLSSSLLVINESIAVTDISKGTIRKAFETAKASGR